jgi:hypothetical protein
VDLGQFLRRSFPQPTSALFYVLRNSRLERSKRAGGIEGKADVEETRAQEQTVQIQPRTCETILVPGTRFNFRDTSSQPLHLFAQ